MSRVIAAVLVGAGVGAAAAAVAHLAGGSDAGDAIVVDASQLAPIARSQLLDVERLIGARAGVASRAEALQAIAAADVVELPTLVWELAESAQSPARDYALHAAVRRLAERDAGRALAVLSQTFLGPHDARAVARIVLAQLEPESASVDATIAAIPQVDAYRLQIDAVEIFADSSVAAALEYAMTLPGRAQRERALHTASPALLEKLDETFAFIDTITNAERRLQFETRLLAELATVDIASASALFTERSAAREFDEQRAALEIMRALYSREPATAIALLQSIGLDSGGGWTRAARAWQARTDPAAGRAFAEQPSRERYGQVRTTVATVLAEQDPDGTIAWLRSLDPMPTDLAEGVIGGVARVDPLRAIDLGEELGVVGRLDRVDALAQSASLIAERVLTVGDPARRAAWLETLLQGWAWVDDVAAMDWAFTNAERLGPEAFDQIGRTHGRNDPAAALQNAMRLPEAAQGPWVESVVRGAMGSDPAAALEWIAQFRGQPFYDMAAASVVSSGQWTDMAPAVAVFDTLSADRQAEVARRLAATWYRADQDAARAWVMGMPANAVRDEALTGLIRFSGYEPDAAVLFELYSSDEVRAEAVLGMLEGLSRRDPAAARRLVDTYVEAPELRARAELLMDAAPRR